MLGSRQEIEPNNQATPIGPALAVPLCDKLAAGELLGREAVGVPPSKAQGADPERAGHPPQRVPQRGLGEPGHALGANAGKSHGPGGEAPPR